jgi:hypothetical protein
MILATSSLILTTTNRLVRIVDRVREMLPEFEKLVHAERSDERKQAMLFDDLGRATIRARLGQQALAQLYLGLGAFLATSIALGVVTFARLDAGWVPLLFGAIGVTLLFSASILLIFESRIALASAYAEMDYIRRISGHLAPRSFARRGGGERFGSPGTERTQEPPGGAWSATFLRVDLDLTGLFLRSEGTRGRSSDAGRILVGGIPGRQRILEKRGMCQP